MPIKPRNVRGFTLVELMITLAVLVILTLLAVPSFQDYMQKARVRGAADQLTDMLARARVASVKNNLPVSVKAGSDSGGWCVGSTQAIEPAAWAPRSLTAASCDCLDNDPVCHVEGEKLMVASSSFGSSPPSMTPTAIDFSYSAKLGGISENGAPGQAFLASSTARSFLVTSPNGRYQASVVVTPLGQSYICIPSGKPPFFGYRAC